ncbi:MFS transporter [Acinetobacter ihumii]|uniref:MFS transporter n=1 Tax=Acinetobacter ihumii TaxID=2483802 RepID=UPI003D710ED7
MDSSHSISPANTEHWISRGSPAYLKAGLALFLLGFASFSMIYCVQPLLPEFTHTFHISPGTSALALSLTTGLLAFSIVLSSAFSQALGRKGLMFISMGLAALLNILCGFAPNWHILLVARALQGFVIGGVPAVAMAWIAEEIHPTHLGKTMGLYIAGTAFGGMMGRVGMGLLTQYFSWRVALGVLGGICLICAFGFLWLLPKSQNFIAQKGIQLRFHLSAWKNHLNNPRLLRIYFIGFLITSIFVTLFNYVTFRLAAAPYHLSQTQISLIFLSYSLGMISSSLAGSLVDKFGRKTAMLIGFVFMLTGIMLTLNAGLFAIVLGIAAITTGYFIAHAIASSNVGLEAKQAKGHATALYLLFYYLGSSIIGSAGGWFWQYGGWHAVVYLTLALVATAILIVLTAPKPAQASVVK